MAALVVLYPVMAGQYLMYRIKRLELRLAYSG